MAILFAGTSPPARPAISIAKDREWPVPKTWTTPPLPTDSASSAAAAAMASVWVVDDLLRCLRTGPRPPRTG